MLVANSYKSKRGKMERGGRGSEPEETTSNSASVSVCLRKQDMGTEGAHSSTKRPGTSYGVVLDALL